MVERGFLQGGAADTRRKMKPDVMIVQITATEQQQYLHHDDNSGSDIAVPLLIELEHTVACLSR